MTYELAWAAGLYDGEGCTSCLWVKGYGYRSFRIDVSQKDRYVLDRFRVAVGGKGIIIGVCKNRDTYMHYLRAYNQNALTIIVKIKPYLSKPKLEQIEKCMHLYSMGYETAFENKYQFSK